MTPDLVFLDVQMPGGTGFDMLAALDVAPAVIFTTAFDQYALRAFDVSALDYLLKPIEAPRLAAALRKFKTAPDAPIEPQQAAPDGKVFIKDGDRCWFVALEQIMLFESEGNYTRVYFDNHRPLLRASRRQIVNLDFVVDIAPNPAGGMTLNLKDDLKVSMSRRRASQFKQLNGL
jgi:two-component system LytT family response regulator